MKKLSISFFLQHFPHQLVLMLVLLFASCATALSPGSKRQAMEPTLRDWLISDLANECFHTGKFDRLQRLSIYPFNKASDIKLISFEEGGFIPVKNKEVDYSKVIEGQLLTSDQKDQLTDILYNIGFDTTIKAEFTVENIYKCYEPRNGILFLDQNNKAFEFIEICFECHRTKPSSQRVSEGTFCKQKFSLLQHFFNEAGIKYGTSLKRPILTYQEILKLDTVGMLMSIKDKLDSKLSHDGTLNPLSDTEQKLIVLLNANSIYDSEILDSGFAGFYFNYSGGFYQQTAAALAEIGATKTLAAFKSSLLQWPGETIPKSMAARREKLLEIVDKAVPKWQAAEHKLYSHKTEFGTSVLTRKEDLQGLILKYITDHKDNLKD